MKKTFHIKEEIVYEEKIGMEYQEKEATGKG